MPLLALDDIRAYLQYEDGDVQQNDFLQRILDAVEAEIVNVCEQPVMAADGNVVFLFRGTGTARKTLPYMPVREITLLETQLDMAGAEWSTLDSSSYDLVADSGYDIRSTTGFNRSQLYRATLTVGYVTAPADLVQLALEMATIAIKQSKLGSKGEDQLGLSEVTKMSGVGVTAQVKFIAMREKFYDRLRPYAIAVY